MLVAITIANLKAALDGLLVMDSIRSARVTLQEFSRVVDNLNCIDPDLEEIARKLNDDRPPAYEDVVSGTGVINAINTENSQNHRTESV